MRRTDFDQDRGARSSNWIPISALVVAVGSLVLGCGVRERYRRFTYQQHLGLGRVIATTNRLRYRATAAQLTGGFDYRPQPRVERGASKTREMDLAMWAVYAEAARLS